MRYNRSIVEVQHKGITVAELEKYRNTLAQRKWYYTKWLTDRQNGVPFLLVRKGMTVETVTQRLANVCAEIEVVNNLIACARRRQVAKRRVRTGL